MSLMAVAAFAQPKFAHVRFSELIQLAPEADAARATITAAQTEAQETFTAMYEEYQAKTADYQAKASVWTPTIKETKEREISDLAQRLQSFEQNIQQELQAQQQALMEPIYKKVTDTVNQLAKEGGYMFVFDVTSVVYVDETQSTDLTPLARKALNIPEGRTLETLQQELQAQATAQQQ